MLGSFLHLVWDLFVEWMWVGALILLWVYLISHIEDWFPSIAGYPWAIMIVTGIPVYLLGPGLTLTFLWIVFFISLTNADEVRRVILLPHFKWMKKWQADVIFYSVVAGIFITLRQMVIT